MSETHQLTYVEDRTVEFKAHVDENGDIVLDHPEAPNVLDVHENSIWCSVCGRLGANEYEAHGISEEWQVY